MDEDGTDGYGGRPEKRGIGRSTLSKPENEWVGTKTGKDKFKIVPASFECFTRPGLWFLPGGLPALGTVRTK